MLRGSYLSDAIVKADTSTAKINSSVDKRDHFMSLCVHLYIFADANERVCSHVHRCQRPVPSTPPQEFFLTHLSLEAPSLSSLELNTQAG